VSVETLSRLHEQLRHAQSRKSGLIDYIEGDREGRFHRKKWSDAWDKLTVRLDNLADETIDASRKIFKKVLGRQGIKGDIVRDGKHYTLELESRAQGRSNEGLRKMDGFLRRNWGKGRTGPEPGRTFVPRRGVITLETRGSDRHADAEAIAAVVEKLAKRFPASSRRAAPKA
jgi:hypothetical protein